MHFSLSRAVTLALVGILLMPSERILRPHKRTHKRHATCEHHLRHHHDSPEQRAKVLRRAARRMQRLEERARLAQERAARAEQVRAAIQDFDESELLTVQAAADPADDDSTLKKKRRKGKMRSRFWALQEAPKIRPGSDFLAMLRHLPERRDALLARSAEPLPHYGSGPCHSFPRPREGTTSVLVAAVAVAA